MKKTNETDVNTCETALVQLHASYFKSDGQETHEAKPIWDHQIVLPIGKFLELVWTSIHSVGSSAAQMTAPVELVASPNAARIEAVTAAAPIVADCSAVWAEHLQHLKSTLSKIRITSKA